MASQSQPLGFLGLHLVGMTRFGWGLVLSHHPSLGIQVRCSIRFQYEEGFRRYHELDRVILDRKKVRLWRKEEVTLMFSSCVVLLYKVFLNLFGVRVHL
ncbi:hypothetical protein Hanom_Chr07g00668451 [Helianthus anomalus]